MKACKLIFFIIFIYSNVYSQADKIITYGTNSNESGSNILILNDNTYIIGARNSSNNFTLLHINNDGLIIKQVTYNNTRSITQLLLLQDNTILIVGSEGNSENNAIAIIKVDLDLNIIWSKKLQSSFMAYAYTARQVSNGDIVLCGYSSTTGVSNANWDCLAFRISNSGSLIWKKVIVTSSSSDWLLDFVELPGRNIVFVGASSLPSVDFLLVKVDANGNIIKSSKYGGSQNEVIYSVLLANNKLVVSAGSWSFGIGEYDMVLSFLDTNFNVEYTKVFGGEYFDFPFYATLNNNEINISGYSRSFNNNQNNDITLFSFTNNGTLIRKKRIGLDGDELSYSRGNNFLKTPSNDYIFTGETNSIGNGLSDIFYVKFNDNSSCCDFTSDINVTEQTINLSSSLVTILSFNNAINSFENFNTAVAFPTPFTATNPCVTDTITTNIINNNLTFCLNSHISFSASSTDPVNLYNWNFGDPGSGSNNVSIDENPSHLFSSIGTFLVTLIAEGSCASDTDTMSITIIQGVELETQINSTKTIYCVGDSVHFTSICSDSGASYTWNFNDPSSGANNTSNGTSPSHIFASIGTYIVSLITQNDCDVDTVYFSIQIIPNSDINIIVNNTTFCVNSPISFSVNSNTPNNIYTWDFGDPSSGVNNFSAEENPNHHFSSTGIFLVTLTSVGVCDSKTDTMSITVIESVDIKTQINSEKTIYCFGDSVHFTSSSNDPNANYFWNFNDPSSGASNVSNNSQPSHLFTSDGTYVISLITLNTCHVDTNYYSIQIIPNTGIDIVSNNTTFCINSPISFSVSINNPGNIYTWDFGDPSSGINNFSAEENPNHHFSSTGTFLVSLIVNGLCASDTDTISVTIIESIDIETKINSVQTLYCLNDTVLFTSISNDPNANYFWNFNDPSSGTNNLSNISNPSHKFTSIGAYNVSLITLNTCHVDTDYFSVQINSVSEADFEYNVNSCLGFVELFNTSSNLTTNNYEWYLNNSLISLNQNIITEIIDEGYHLISLVVNPNTNCVDTITKEVYFIKPDDTYGVLIPDAFSPNNDGINDIYKIYTSFDCKLQKMIVFNRWGEAVYESTSIFEWHGNENNKLNESGTYIVYIEFDNTKHHKTIQLIR